EYNVLSISIKCQRDTTLITISTDAKAAVQDQVLRNPDRLVLDFIDGVDKLPANEFKGLPPGLAISVRASQFRTTPQRIARVIIDLSEMPKHYAIVTGENSVLVTVITPGYPAMEWHSGGAAPPAKPKTETPAAKVESTKVVAKPDTAKSPAPAPVPAPTATAKAESAIVKEVSTTADTSADTTSKAKYIRKKVIYEIKSERDPFVSVKLTKKHELGSPIVPSIEHIKLVGIVGQENNYAALLQDEKGFGYIMTVGDSVENGSVTAVADTGITFTVDEFGYVRSITLPLPKEIK
ncbi:MAG: AMIN domain-containing protein, partial [Thermoproteales archaeon]|nr:AMIN domain-containing protein [Thermoproteales archaeon]